MTVKKSGSLGRSRSGLMGTVVRSFLPINNSARLYPFFNGVARYAIKARKGSLDFFKRF